MSNERLTFLTSRCLHLEASKCRKSSSFYEHAQDFEEKKVSKEGERT